MAVTTLLTVAMAGSIALCLYAVITVPRWLFTSLNRGCMWELRDDISLAWINGDLPREEPTQQLVRRVEKGIGFAHLLSPPSLRRIQALIDHVGWTDDAELASLDDLRRVVEAWPKDQLDRYQAYVARFEFLLRRQYFTGSWAGVVRTLWFGGRALLPPKFTKARLWRQPGRRVVPIRSTRPGLVQVSLWAIAFEVPERTEAAQQMVTLDGYVDGYQPPVSDDPAAALTPV